MDIIIYSNTGDHIPNEDYSDFMIENDIVCAIVADGLGGHGCGEIASETVVKGALKAFKENPEINEECMSRCFKIAFDSMQDKMHEKHEYMDMKSTLSILITDGKKYIHGHVGDTRIYGFSKSKVILQTLDHSVPQALVASGKLKSKNIRYHEDRNRLLRVMGTNSMPKVDISPVKRLQFNIKGVLLCTDGFWEHIEEKTMINLLNTSVKCDEWIKEMAEEIKANGNKNAKGKMDNYTCLGVKL